MSPFQFARRTELLKPSVVREILKTTQNPQVISFAGGMPAPELFPVDAIARATQKLLAEDGPAALQYSVTEGYPPLRAWLCDHLAKATGIRTTPDQLLITTGSQQALDLVARALIDPGDLILTEQPAYLGALQAFQAAEASLRGLPSDEHGLRPDALEQTLATEHPKFLYLTPTFQNPTGNAMSLDRRRQIATIAAAHNLPIFEDDPYGRLRYSGNPLPAIASLPEARNIIYLGTASKILTPGLRVAWLSVPDHALYERLVTLKQSADLHTSSFTQRIVHAVASDDAVFPTHLQKLVAAYRERRDTMLRALEAHMPEGTTWTRPDGGMFLWATLPEGIDTHALLPAALAHNVAYVPGHAFHTGDIPANTMRLNFSHSNPARIEEGIRRLADVIKNASVPAHA